MTLTTTTLSAGGGRRPPGPAFSRPVHGTWGTYHQTFVLQNDELSDIGTSSATVTPESPGAQRGI
jgi:hypothetical protein